MYSATCIFGIVVWANAALLLQDDTRSKSPTKEPVQSTLTLHTQSRLVSVDVLVEDSEGKPVTGLEQSDFAVFDNGKQQTIRFFDKREPVPLVPNVAQSQPAELRYSNLPDYQKPASFNILLLDALNTPIAEQQHAQKQLIAVLKTLPPGAPIAILSLHSELSVVQGLTANRNLLAHVAEHQVLFSSPMLTGTSEKDHQAYDAEEKALELARPAGAGGSESPFAAKLHQESKFLKRKAAALEYRAAWTLNAMRLLAASLSKLEGRKNVFWISSAFPLILGPNPPNDSFVHNRNYSSELRTTAALLAASRVAIYPIDVNGVQIMGQAIETPGTLEFKDLQLRQTTDLWASHETMSELADQTGGQAFYGSNDLSKVLKDALGNGSSYYTLSYVPEAKDWNDQYRRTDVKLSHRKAKLIFRKGYFALRKKKDDTTAESALFGEALAPAADDPFKIGLSVSVLPPDASDNTVRLTYSINAHNLVALGTESAKSLRLDMVTLVWDSKNREQGRSAESFDIVLHGEEYARALTDGLQVPRHMLLPSGTYSVSSAIIDRTSQRVGVVRFPLVIP